MLNSRTYYEEDQGHHLYSYGTFYNLIMVRVRIGVRVGLSYFIKYFWSWNHFKEYLYIRINNGRYSQEPTAKDSLCYLYPPVIP